MKESANKNIEPGFVNIPVEKLSIILSMAVSKREADEESLPQETALLKEMREYQRACRMKKKINIV